jgi:hypothetical protein
MSPYRVGEAGLLRGIAELVKQIPQELLILPADQYARLIIALGAIEQCFLTGESADGRRIYIENINGRDAVVLLREYCSNARISTRRHQRPICNSFRTLNYATASGAMSEPQVRRLGQLPLTEQANGISAALSQGKLKQKPAARRLSRT